MSCSSTRKRGRESERLALEYLLVAGYRFVRRNFATASGEIDLIMEAPDRRTLVFIEVKSGDSDFFPAYKEAVTAEKCQKIIKVALSFIENLKREYEGFRIDAVFVERGCSKQIQHLKNIYIL